VNIDIDQQPSSWREVALVLGGSLLFFAPGLSKPSLRFTNGLMAALIIFEIVYGILVVVYLHRRGWRLSSISLPPTKRDALRALGVFIVGYLVYIGSVLFASFFLSTQAAAVANMRVSGAVGFPLVILLAIINPVFEEGLWLAYCVNGPARDKPAMTYIFSVGIRTFVHGYQGWLAIFGIAPLGAWFLYYYLQTRRLTPVLIAHGLYDLTSIIILKYTGYIG